MTRCLTPLQKVERRIARRLGTRAIRAILNACYPVYDDDGAFWEARAVDAARGAWRSALAAEAMAPTSTVHKVPRVPI